MDRRERGGGRPHEHDDGDEPAVVIHVDELDGGMPGGRESYVRLRLWRQADDDDDADIARFESAALRLASGI